MIRVGLLLTTLLFIAMGVGIYVGGMLDPRVCDWRWHAGKTRAQWFELLESSFPDERQEAVQALAAIGEPCVEGLIVRVCEHSSPAREDAMRALSLIGEPAVEPLCRAYVDKRRENRKPRLRDALVRIGPAALPHLIRLMLSENRDERLLAYAVLIELKPPADVLVPELLTMPYRKDEANQSIELARGAGQLGVPIIIQLIKCGDSETQACALIHLGEMGRAAADAIPILIDLTEKVDESLAAALCQTIARIQSAD